MKKRKSFTAEYKKEIAKLIFEKGKLAKDVAVDIDVHLNTVNKWVKQYQELGDQAFPGKGNLSSRDQELYDLKKKIKDLEEENEILKKATAIFANHKK